MNSSNVLQLPTFDPSDDSFIVESEPFEPELIEPELSKMETELPDLGSAEAPGAAFDIDESEDHWEPDPQVLDELNDDIDTRFGAIEDVLQELSNASSLMQLEVAARVEEIVQGITNTLFPKLAEDFLAEEISRFLAYAVPREAMKVDIAVPAPLAGELTQSLSRNPALMDFCVVRELDPGAPPAVNANWGDGGFDYDLTSLLAACHARTFQNSPEIEDEEEWPT